MAGRFDFHSPGAAALGALRQVLMGQDQRRRQALLDSLAIDREKRLTAQDATQAEISREQLESLKESRQSAAAQREQQTRTAAIANAEKTQRIGDVAAPDTPAELTQGRQLASKHYGGMLPAIAGPQMVGTDAAGPTGPIQMEDIAAKAGVYTGTVAQREAEDKKGRVRQFIASNPVAQKNPELQALLQAAEATGDYGSVDQAIMQLMKSNASQPRNIWVDRKGGMHLMAGGGLQPLPADFEARPEDKYHNEPAPPGGVGANLSLSLGEDAIDMMARTYLQTNQMPALGQGQAAVKMRQQIIDRAAAMAKEGGINPVANAADYGADKAALTQASKQYTAVHAFKETARKNIEVLQNVLKDTPDVGVPLLNKPWRWVVQQTGDTRIAKFRAALGTVQPEISRILNSANLTGVNTVHAQQEVEKMLDPNATVEQLIASLKVLEADMANRETSMLDQIGAVRGNIQSRDPGRPQPTTSDETPEQRKKRLADKYLKAR